MEEAISKLKDKQVLNKDDLMIQMLQDIKTNQSTLMSQLNMMAIEQEKLKTDVTIMRNGYEPHEITQLFHWVKAKKDMEQDVHIDIKRAFIGWLVPVICTILAVGVIAFN